MFRAATAITVVIVCILNNANGQRNQARRQKVKLHKMMTELLLDGVSKGRGINSLKPYYSSTVPYSVSSTTCKVRLKFLRMIFIYKRSKGNLYQWHYGIHVEIMLEITRLFKDIDGLVSMMETWMQEEEEKEKQAASEKKAAEEKKRLQKIKWQIKQDTQKISVREEHNHDETNKYMNGFESDFNI